MVSKCSSRMAVACGLRDIAIAAVRAVLLCGWFVLLLIAVLHPFASKLASALVFLFIAKSTWRFWLLPLALLACSNAAHLPSTSTSSSSSAATTIGDNAILAMCIIALCIGSVITWQQLGSSQLATAPQPTKEQVGFMLNWYSHWRSSIDQQLSRTEAGLAAARALQAQAENAAEAESAVMKQRRIGEIAAMAQKRLALQSALPPRVTIPIGALLNCDLDDSLLAHSERLAWMGAEAQNMPPAFLSAIARRARIGHDAAQASHASSTVGTHSRCVSVSLVSI